MEKMMNWRSFVLALLPLLEDEDQDRRRQGEGRDDEAQHFPGFVRHATLRPASVSL
jgi:hypothetical protein